MCLKTAHKVTDIVFLKRKKFIKFPACCHHSRIYVAQKSIILNHEAYHILIILELISVHKKILLLGIQ